MAVKITPAAGERICAFEMTNDAGASATVTNYGATLMDVIVPDRQGRMGSVVLGYDSPMDYTHGNPGSLGAVCGRYANRIKKGYTLGGRYHSLPLNNGENQLHGGVAGFARQIFEYEAGEESVTFAYTSPDGEMGHPGEVRVQVRYTFDAENALHIAYTAQTDADTYLNLTNHAYFNLKGQGDILSHELRVDADAFTPTDDSSCPTGEIRPVAETPLDFRQAKPLGRDMDADFHQIRLCGGFDNNFCLRSGAPAAELYEPSTGRLLTVETDMPGLQVYCGQFLHVPRGRGGAAYGPFGGVALETQFFPNSPNIPSFPSCLLRPGDTYSHETVYRFGIR